MKTLFILASLGLLAGVLAACSKRGIETLDNRTPPLRLEEFFQGETIAWGIFEDRFGNLRRQFRVNITGTVEGDIFILLVNPVIKADTKLLVPHLQINIIDPV